MILPQGSPAQNSRGKKVNRGPRALGLVELSPNGKALLIPITILVEGQYYDASVYKASPVPMALWSETVYEGVKAGDSQGLFTIREALQNQKTSEWTAEGSWQSAASLAVKSTKKSAGSAIPRGLNDDEGPPILRHSGAEKPKPPETIPSAPAPPATPPAPTGTTSNAPPATSTPPAASTPPTPSAPQDQNQPTLKRGRPAAESSDIELPSSPAPAKSAEQTKSVSPAIAKSAPAIQLIPAISDANGPDPHSYAYDLKPDEQDQLRKKMLALAADQVYAYVKQLSGGSTKPAAPPSEIPRHHKVILRPTPPQFENVEFDAFDLYSANEPTFVLTAKARLPQGTAGSSPDLQYLVTLVNRQDVNGDLHKVFANVTDTQHLDIAPQYQFIDAVDADGDGNGELLFRKVSDAGFAFDVYRVIGDQLYPLFQGSL